tara:strand:+ start:724 stop:2103 length:1380 start_codon:yes stop_codon:yes gene_type:complete
MIFLIFGGDWFSSPRPIVNESKHWNKDGVAKTYHEDIEDIFMQGPLKIVGKYESGNRVGVFKTYYKNGALQYISTHKDTSTRGKLASNPMEPVFHGKFQEFFKDIDGIKVEGYFNNGKKHGVWKEYYVSGKLKEEQEWNYKKDNGIFKEYLRDGTTLKAEGKCHHAPDLYKRTTSLHPDTDFSGSDTDSGVINGMPIESHKIIKTYNNIEKHESSNSKLLSQVYPELIGVDFNNVKSAPNGDSPESMFCSDIDGSWYFAVKQMTMLFKAVSIENFANELSFILEQNDIKLEAKVEKNGFVAWKGQGFQLEHAVIKGCNVIIITNEDVAPVDSDKLKTTALAPEVDLPDGYKNIGIEHIYDGDKFLKANHGKFSLNIPLLFKDPNDGLNYIIIGITTLTLAKKIIDDIIEKNYGETYFTKLENRDDWEYVFHNKFFSIGFMTKNFCVRINMLHNLVDLKK